MYKWLILVFFLCTTPVVNLMAGEKTGFPALIPMPQIVTWTSAFFDLSSCSGGIVIETGSLKGEAVRLQDILKKAGIFLSIRQAASAKSKTVFLALGAVKAVRQPGEAYHLSVTEDQIILQASTTHGIFNGLQTLWQLIDADKRVQGCAIEDYPAFGWRGYMVDVGRNYQSPAQLKQQIDMMAKYKLNIFHFHLTEDIAWRLQIKKYPQLTAAKFSERNKGKFYSIEEMKDLISYCQERYITLVPEIDVPGHSAAFSRAMGEDMQSEKGAAIVKEIFNEICKTYDIPYLHIGADEVRITNEAFIPGVTEVIRKHKKQIIAWAPGGNYDDGIIRQLWKEEGEKEVANNGIKYIDSKFLYISDFDPLNSVVTIFNRQFGEKNHSDSVMLGAEFCLWNDRNVNDETDLLSRNPVYPALLAFAERSWKGGGFPGVNFYIGEDSSQRAKDFHEFESRILIHKEKYFSHLPFLYVKQTHVKWKLFGPFENKGDLSQSYWPEQSHGLLDSAATLKATGGTVWLWHTHGPKVKAWVPAPRENTTWYAYTQIWSDSNTTLSMWIDVKDLSRSGADATPPKGEWDYMKSKLWINKTLIPPPQWTHPGRASGKLSEPMEDENYYYRAPKVIDVKKGWNEILVKLPMSVFDPHADWQVPPKWMFTLIPVQKGKGINWNADEISFRIER